MLLVLASGVVFVFFASLEPSARTRNDAEYTFPVSSLETGKVQAFSIGGRSLFILRPSAQQMESIRHLEVHVADKVITSYIPSLDAFVYFAESTKRGCQLQELPPQKSRFAEYIKDSIWLGGYWDPICEVSYDYAGRAISTHNYTFNGYDAKFPNLKVPSVRLVGDTAIVSLL